jgi:hypothetical protein
MSALNVYGAGADEILYRYVAAGSQRFRYHHDIHGNVVALLDWWGNGLEKQGQRGQSVNLVKLGSTGRQRGDLSR